ncbi:MAG TPA: DHH family phosphoesterase [Desulfomonilia bacterium]|jgi:nanoRNase/pAp phosphatase (c-di-AMP/oligoRNAs hydrolase)|nr:DHH family phosphoesterase [Desulfomonilia bacterium]
MTRQELTDKLLKPLKGKRKVLIIAHENPDPDSIAAAYGLKFLFRKAAGVTAVIAYSGIIGRAENRAMVKMLDIDLVPLAKVNPRNYSIVAVVDCQPHTGNLNLPKGVFPNIIIDHHPVRKTSLKADYHDLPRDVGSTSTVITQYLRTLGIEPDRKVATALYYGIKSDTRDLGRQSTDDDIRASIYLFPHILQKKLSRIEHPELPRQYFQELNAVLTNTLLYGEVVVARVEVMSWPEMIGEFADELIQMEGVRWCMCYGRHNGSLLFSIRAKRTNDMAGVLAHKIATGIGKGGGHETFAAGKIDVVQALKKVKDPEDILVKRFLKEVNPKGMDPVRLINHDKEPPRDRALPVNGNP